MQNKPRRRVVAKRLIQSQLKDLVVNPLNDVLVTTNDDDKYEWIVTISALSQDYFPYTGGTFIFAIRFDHSYPFVIPRIRCQTLIFHMNINKKGIISIPLHGDDAEFEWKHKIHTPRDIIKEIVDTLKQPHTPSCRCMNEMAAMIFNTSEKLYNEIAKDYTQKFAINGKIISDKDKNKFANNDFDMKGYCVSWKQIRLIWIGYHKNNNNNDCFISLLPKDIVKKIIDIAGLHVDTSNLIRYGF